MNTILIASKPDISYDAVLWVHSAIRLEYVYVEGLNLETVYNTSRLKCLYNIPWINQTIEALMEQNDCDLSPKDIVYFKNLEALGYTYLEL